MVLHCILLCRAPTNDIQSHRSKLPVLGNKEIENRVRVPVTGIHLRDTGSLLERVPVVVKHDWEQNIQPAAAVFFVEIAVRNFPFHIKGVLLIFTYQYQPTRSA